MRFSAGLVGAILAAAGPALAQPAGTQFVDLAVLSVEVRGPAEARAGTPLEVSARILRRDGGPPEALDTVVRFQTAGDARPFAERRISLPPDGGAVVSVPWPARAGRNVISVAVGPMTPRTIDRTRGNDVLTTADIVVPARPAPATAVAAQPLGAQRAAAFAASAPALSAISAPRSAIAAGALGAVSAPRAGVTAPALAASSAPRQSVDAPALSAASAPPPAPAQPAAADAAPAQPGTDAPAPARQP